MPRAKQRKFWQTNQFRELQKEWNSKLKDSGFKDAEDSGRHTGKMRQKAFNCYRTQIPEIIEAKQRYFELLGQGHHAEDFSDPVEKYVMERRSHGANIKEIGNELRSAGKKNSHETIRKIIRHYEKKWNVKPKKT